VEFVVEFEISAPDEDPASTALGDIRYTLQTDAGEPLYVQSRGLRHGSAQVLARLGRGVRTSNGNDDGPIAARRVISCREALPGSAHQAKGHGRRGPRHRETTTMPKYLLLKHYRGGPEPHHPFPPMDQWAPEDVEAHMAFLRHVSELLRENGEYVDVRALTPARTWVRYGGPDAAPVTTDGPLPETSDLVAGWYMIDVESHERAVEIAAYVSSEPGPGGEPLYEWIDVREIMSGSRSED
jgi:hypothetical protein